MVEPTFCFLVYFSSSSFSSVWFYFLKGAECTVFAWDFVCKLIAGGHLEPTFSCYFEWISYLAAAVLIDERHKFVDYIANAYAFDSKWAALLFWPLKFFMVNFFFFYIFLSELNFWGSTIKCFVLAAHFLATIS